MNKNIDANQSRAEELTEKLHAHGVFPTRQRLIIARAMFEKRQHLTADQLLQRINRDGEAGVSRATVYNTLAAFLRRGLIAVVNTPGGTVYFDSEPNAHIHLFDEQSGELVDADIDPVALAEKVPLPEGMQLIGTDVLLRVRRQ